MNVAQSGSANMDTHSVNVGGSPAGTENLAATSTIAASTSADPPQNHGYPPCNCWHNPKDKRDGRAPIPLNLVLPPVRTELARAIRALNSIITLIEERAATGPEDTAKSPPPDVLDAFSSQREVVVNCFETASIIITTTPGYVCKQDSVEHERCYSERYKELSDVEDIFTRSIKDAEPLLKARDELLVEERRQRRRRYVQSAFRAMSIITIPYSPLLSAILTAADVFGISVDMAIQRFGLPDADEVGMTLENAASLEKSIREIRQSVDEIKRIKEHLEAAKVKLEEAQRRPIAAHLAGILYKVHLAKDAVEGALCACPHAAVPIRDVVASLQNTVEALGEPEMVVGPLASLGEDYAACMVVDRALAVLRRLAPASKPAGSE